MAMWIELAPQSMFWKRLICTSNIVELPPLKFTYKKRTMTVESNQRLVVSVDDWMCLKTHNVVFKAEVKGIRLHALVSDTATLRFDWLVPSTTDSTNVLIECSGRFDGSYMVRNKVYPIAVMTRVRVESIGENCDLNLMVACLAYFWTFFEQERLST